MANTKIRDMLSPLDEKTKSDVAALLTEADNVLIDVLHGLSEGLVKDSLKQVLLACQLSQLLLDCEDGLSSAKVRTAKRIANSSSLGLSYVAETLSSHCLHGMPKPTEDS